MKVNGRKWCYCSSTEQLKKNQYPNPLSLGPRLSPFPRVETRFNTHYQNAYANETPFSSCCVYHRSLSIASTSREEAYVGRWEIYSASQKKQTPETKVCCDHLLQIHTCCLYTHLLPTHLLPICPLAAYIYTKGPSFIHTHVHTNDTKH